MMATRAIPGSGNMPPSRLNGRWHTAANDAGKAVSPAQPTAGPTGSDTATPLVAPLPVTSGYVAAGYGPSRRSRVIAMAAVSLLHVAAIGTLVTHRFLTPVDPAPQAITLLDLSAAPPPPMEATVPELLFETPDIVVPPPVIDIAPTAPVITARVAETPPAPAIVTRPAADAAPVATAAPAGPVTTDLAANMVHMVPPRYPYESRRLKEQGTVILDVTLATDGRVDAIRVRESSGHTRLDRAALDAVRQWRWSPTMRDGVAITVRGLVEIPFILAPGRRR